MEQRTITVIDTRTDRVKTIQSSAETVAELKRDLGNAGISTEGMTIQEGLTKTEFITNDAILPRDVNYKGVVTNNLVIRLTVADKKIKSGADRKEVYAEIKALGIADKIKEFFGKNYTQVSTDALVVYLQNSSKKCCKATPKKKEIKNTLNLEPIKQAILYLANALCDEDFLDYSVVLEIQNIFEGDDNPTKYSRTELDDMFANM